MRWMCVRPRPPSETGLPVASRNSQPRARAAPTPPSTVALPPSVSRICSAPTVAASSSSSPVPRELRVGAACRRGPEGEVEQELTPRELQRVVAAVRRLRPTAIAIGFLHSPVDDTDERRVAQALAKALPEVPITTSAVSE